MDATLVITQMVTHGLLMDIAIVGKILQKKQEDEIYYSIVIGDGVELIMDIIIQIYLTQPMAIMKICHTFL